MKNLLPFLLFVSLTSAATPQNFDGGVLFGLTANQIDGDAYRGYNKVGIQGGGWVRRMFTYTLGGQMELRYVQKGALKTRTANDPTYQRTALHFIDIPLTTQYIYNKNIILELGFDPEILMSVRVEDENGLVPGFNPDDYHRITLSAIAGMGYRFLEVFSVYFRFNYSILPIRPHPSGQTWLLNQGHYCNTLSIALYCEIGYK